MPLIYDNFEPSLELDSLVEELTQRQRAALEAYLVGQGLGPELVPLLERCVRWSLPSGGQSIIEQVDLTRFTALCRAVKPAKEIERQSSGVGPWFGLPTGVQWAFYRREDARSGFFDDGYGLMLIELSQGYWEELRAWLNDPHDALTLTITPHFILNFAKGETLHFRINDEDYPWLQRGWLFMSKQDRAHCLALMEAAHVS